MEYRTKHPITPERREAIGENGGSEVKSGLPDRISLDRIGNKIVTYILY